MELINHHYLGKKLVYRKTGVGIPVILVHGFAEDGEIFRFQTDFLKTRALIIVPDLPGSGSSEYNETMMTMDDYADCINAILENEKITQCIMIGHSMGGYITLAFTERYPEKVLRYGLFHSSAFPDDDEKKLTREKAIRFINEHGSSKFLEQSVPNLFSDITKEQKPSLVGEIISKYSNFAPEALVQYYEAMIRRPDRRNVLKSASKPVLLILGQYDSAVPIDKGLVQAHIPEICYIHICKKSGHMGMLEETEFCNHALEEFIADK